MLELLMQAPDVGVAARCLYFEAAAATAFDWLPPLPAAADDADGGRAAVKAEEAEAAEAAAAAAAAAAAGIEDVELDLFFEPLHHNPTIPLDPMAPPKADDSSTLLFDSGTEEFLCQLLLADNAMCGEDTPPVAEADQSDDSSEELLSSTSPASFEPTPESPSSPAPSSPTCSSASSSSRRRGVAGGRVDRKKEANREAAYRYRMKQRLGDSALEERRAQLQSRADELAGGVGRAEEEAGFLLQMCRQIFASRRQLALAGGLLAHS